MRRARFITKLGVNFLSMSPSSELESGPSFSDSGPLMDRMSVYQMGFQWVSREFEATVRAVGWGGFTDG